MSVGFSTGAYNSAASGNGPLSLTGVTSGQPLIIFCGGVTMPTITDTFATPYTYTQITTTGGGPSGQLIVGTGGSGTSGTLTSSGDNLILVAPCTGASLASGAAIIDQSAPSSSNTSTGNVTPSVAGEAVIGMIQSPYEGIDYTGSAYAESPGQIGGYPVWIAPDDLTPAQGSPVSFSFGTFGRAAGSIVCCIFPTGYPIVTARLVMPL